MTHYSLEWLVEQIERGFEREYLFFWGHTSSDNSTAGSQVLSQWFPSAFTVGEKTYRTAEHWMMASKARLFGDNQAVEKIIDTDSPKEAKRLGSQVLNFEPDTWQSKCYEIVVEGNFQKFSQHSHLKQYLLSTNDKVLVEASPIDPIWGNGHSKDSKESKNPKSWRGQNLLGFALMQVRDRLKA